MKIILKKTDEVQPDNSCIYLVRKTTNLEPFSFSKTEFEYLKNKLDDGEKQLSINSYFKQSFIQVLDEEKEFYTRKEDLRKAAFDWLKQVQSHKIEKLVIIDELYDPELALAFLEGLLLSSYKFGKYLTEKKEKGDYPMEILVYSAYISEDHLKEIEILTEAVFMARDLVNEPVIYLNAEKLADTIHEQLLKTGCRVEILNKNRIQSLRMGGLLAVNRGSVDPPTFTIAEWKPEDALNEKPVILIGKGVVYDTGGLSLKPTPDSMDYMKSDMSGAAVVFGLMYAISARKLPLYTIGLIPATDNRPGGNAITPGDVISMYNGTSVEIVNTDAEGRLLLADALSYARKYDPLLAIDLATLTGSAQAAIGKEGIVAFSTTDDDSFRKLEECGWNTYERLVKFPLWDEYKESLKSDIADLKNLGGKTAGAVTAAKFLQHFTDYPWIHLDIAGTSFLKSTDSYRGKGATATGIRLIYDFLKNYL